MTTPFRTCRECAHYLPISEFRLTKRGQEKRSVQCRKCHNRAERNRRQILKNKHSISEIRKLNNRIKRAASDRQVQVVCSQMVMAFGGVENFVQEWLKVWEIDREKGRAKCFSHIATVVRLIMWVDNHRNTYATMSDEELLERTDLLSS